MLGYDEAWVNESETKDLVCAICSYVARDLVQHSCGAPFCDACFRQNQAGGHPCTNCREPGDATAANRDRLAVQNLTIRCPADCGATFRLGDKDQHLLVDKCAPSGAHAAAAAPKTACVWVCLRDASIQGAATLFRRDVGSAAVCDLQCDSLGQRYKYSNLVGKACAFCAMDAACRRGWEYVGETGPHWHALRKRL